MSSNFLDGDLPITLEEVRAEKSRRRLADMLRYGWHVLEPSTPLIWNWHLEALCDHIQAVLEGWIRTRDDATLHAEIQNLLINIPPGTMKSRILMVYAVAWMWLHCPSWRVICLSGNPRVALRDSMYCRELIRSQWYQEWFKPEWQLADDQNAKSLFKTTAGGFRYAAGITAELVGDRGDAIFIDDANGPNDSEADLRRVIDNYSLTIGNRVNDLRCSVRISIQQRTHEQDFSGYILSTKQNWYHMSLPMEYEPPDEGQDKAHSPIGWSDPRTIPGEVLHPERFTPEVLAAERLRLGSYGYAGQMQQRPTPIEGGLFKRSWWRFFRYPDDPAEPAPRPKGCYTGPARELPKSCLKMQLLSLDCTFKDTDGTDFVVFGILGWHGADRYLLDVVIKRMDFVQTCDTLTDLVGCHSPDPEKRKAGRWPRCIYKIVEDKANGPAVINSLRRIVPGLIGFNPEGSKTARAMATSPQVESGNVFLRDGAAWVDAVVDQCAAFPKSKHDDIVDMISMALIRLSGSADAARAAAMCTP